MISQQRGAGDSFSLSSGLRSGYGGLVAMRKDVREFIRRLEAVGLTVEATPGHYHVYRDGKPLRRTRRQHPVIL